MTVTVAGAPAAGRVASWTRSLLGRRRAGLSVLLCGDARMKRLNRAWRGLDRPTDVLSFPAEQQAYPRSPKATRLPRRQPPYLGDLVIDVPYAARQARRLGHALTRELQVLLAHGVLHLLGHDHENDDGTMFRLQRRWVRRAFGPGPDGVPEPEGS